MKKIPVGILGATGMVGQSYISLLENHPQFEVVFLATSSNAKNIKERWQQPKPLPDKIRSMPLYSCAEIKKARMCKYIFSALRNSKAKEWEEQYARAGLRVISSSSHHRHFSDIPMIIPEINSEHLEIIETQQKNRGWDQGFIITKPNCTLQSYLIPLFSIHKTFGIKKLIITAMQAVSGGGCFGATSLEMMDNIVPYIEGEEEKLQIEPLKILGHIRNGKIIPIDTIKISAHCNRVPLIDGHLTTVSVELESKTKASEIEMLWKSFQGVDLVSAPKHPIIYQTQQNRPQPRLDRLAGNGMSVTVGRLRECPVLDYRFVSLSHNTIRGAAGGGILIAEQTEAFRG